MSAHYCRGHSDYRRGGYNNGHRGGFRPPKVNKEDVPVSRHALFVRGLPSSIPLDAIKTFFEDKIGPCSFVFDKVNYERQELFFAIRFKSEEDAKEAHDRYNAEDILGCRCEVTWFRDIRRYIAYTQEHGGLIRRGGNFGRGQLAKRGNNRTEYRKRRHSRRSRSRSRSIDSDGSRASRRSSRDGSSRESDRRRSELKDGKRKEKKAKKASKEDRRGHRSVSESSGSEGESSRSSSSDERKGRGRKRARTDPREVSPASSTGSPLRMTTSPVLPNIIENVFSSAVSTPIESSAPLRISISNKSTVPVENTSFKMALDTDEPPRKIVRLSPEKKITGDVMEVEKNKEEEAPSMTKTPVVDAKEKGGWTTAGDHCVPPSDVMIPSPPPPPSFLPSPPSVSIVAQPSIFKLRGLPKEILKEIQMIPRSVGAPNPPSKRPPMVTPSSLPPPPAQPSIVTAPTPPSIGEGVRAGKGAPDAFTTKCPEIAKTSSVIKTIQDQLITSVRPNNRLSLSDVSSGESLLKKMEEREKKIKELDPNAKSKFDLKMKQTVNSYRGDAQTITTVVKSLVQKDPTLADKIKPALLAVLEDVEKQIYKKVGDFLVCDI